MIEKEDSKNLGTSEKNPSKSKEDDNFPDKNKKIVPSEDDLDEPMNPDHFHRT